MSQCGTYGFAPPARCARLPAAVFRRLFGSGLVLLALLTAAAWAVTNQARATILLQTSIEDLAAGSVAVVHARVARTEARIGGPNGLGGIYTYVALDVIEYVRGSGPLRTEVVVHGGRVGLEASMIAGQARFAPGEEVVVFLFRGGEALWVDGMAMGKWTVVRDRSGHARATRSLAGVSLAAPGPDGRIAPVPRIDERTMPTEMSLDELLDRIRSVP